MSIFEAIVRQTVLRERENRRRNGSGRESDLGRGRRCFVLSQMWSAIMDYERAGLLCHVYRSVSGVHGFLFVMAMSQSPCSHETLATADH